MQVQNIPEAEEVPYFFLAGVVGNVLDLENVSLFNWRAVYRQH